MRPFLRLLISTKLAVLCGFFVFIGCAKPTVKSSSKNILQVTTSNLLVLENPSQKTRVGPVYLDSVYLRVRINQVGIELVGNLPDGCSKLHITETTEGLNVVSWKPNEVICTMALEPLRGFYGITNEELRTKLFRSDSILINDTFLKLWKR